MIPRISVSRSAKAAVDRSLLPSAGSLGSTGVAVGGGTGVLVGIGDRAIVGRRGGRIAVSSGGRVAVGGMEIVGKGVTDGARVRVGSRATVGVGGIAIVGSGVWASGVRIAPNPTLNVGVGSGGCTPTGVDVTTRPTAATTIGSAGRGAGASTNCGPQPTATSATIRLAIVQRTTADTVRSRPAAAISELLIRSRRWSSRRTWPTRLRSRWRIPRSARPGRNTLASVLVRRGFPVRCRPNRDTRVRD